MEHKSSFNKQLRKEITAGSVMNKKIKMLEIDIDENNKKIYDGDKEIKNNPKSHTLKKTIKSLISRNVFRT